MPYFCKALCATAIVAPVLVSIAACETDAPVGVAFSMSDPLGLVDEATSMKLFVFDQKDGACNADGTFGTPPANAKAFDLSRDDCTGGGWCGQITLDQDGSKKTFGVQAQRATELFATGCGSATIDRDPVDVSIKLFRAVPPACCNNGVLEVGELCDTGAQATVACGALPGGTCGGIVADAVCGCDCSTNEIPIDRVVGAAAPNPGEKTGVALAFGPGNMGLSNGLRALFDDVGAGSVGGHDVQLRALDQNLFPIADTPLDKPGPLPLRCGATTGTSRVQTGGAIAPFTATSMVAAYASDTRSIGVFDAYVVEIGPYGCADLAPVQANVVQGDVTSVDVATGPSDTSLVTWQQGGRVMGRIFTKATGLGTEVVIAASGKTPRVAGFPGGFVVAYEGPGGGDDDGIFIRRVTPTGAAEAEIPVNVVTAGVQDQPDIAMLPDGRAVVAFRSAGDVYAQRFSAQLARVDGDQNAALHATVDGEQGSPAVAGGLSKLFVVAWEDQRDGSIRARYLGGTSEFLFNPIDGQNTDFPASSPAIAGTRRRPAAAIGGNGFVALGWHDESPAHAGAFVRRFPLPATE